MVITFQSIAINSFKENPVNQDVSIYDEIMYLTERRLKMTMNVKISGYAADSSLKSIHLLNNCMVFWINICPHKIHISLRERDVKVLTQ